MTTSSLTAAAQLANPKFLALVQNRLLVRYFLRLDNVGRQEFYFEIVGGSPTPAQDDIAALQTCSQFKGSTSFGVFPRCVMSSHGAQALQGLKQILDHWEHPVGSFPQRTRYLQTKDFVGIVEMGGATYEVGPQHPLFLISHGMMTQSLWRCVSDIEAAKASWDEDLYLRDISAAEVLAERFEAFVRKQQLAVMAQTLILPSIDLSAFLSELREEKG